MVQYIEWFCEKQTRRLEKILLQSISSLKFEILVIQNKNTVKMGKKEDKKNQILVFIKNYDLKEYPNHVFLILSIYPEFICIRRMKRKIC